MAFYCVGKRCQRRVLREKRGNDCQTSVLGHHFGVEDGLKRERLGQGNLLRGYGSIQARDDKKGLKSGMWTV